MSLVRVAEVSDIPIIAQLESLYIECAWSEKMLEDSFKNSYNKFYVLCDDSGQINAYGGIQATTEAEIFNVAVRQSYRGKGYAKQIICALISCAKKSESVFLEVNQHNTAAIMLYKSVGFTQVGLRKNYYKSGDAIIMKKYLIKE